MRLSKTLAVLRKVNLHNRRLSVNVFQNAVLKRCSSTADSSVVQDAGDQQASALDQERKELKGPFVKNFFAGVFDEAILEYPEYPSMELVNEVKGVTNHVEEYFFNCVDSKAIDEEKIIPEEVLNFLKESKLFGITAPQKVGGLELDDRCLARYCEAVGTDMSVSTYLATHTRALTTILLYANEEQKNKYLGRLVSGDITCGFCMLENGNIFDTSDINTVALPNENGDWVINGKKIWVTNGCKADFYIVFAKTWQGSVNPVEGSLLTVFLIDKNTPGIQCGPPLEQLGTRGVEMCDVTFNNVTVKNDSVLGQSGSGSEVAFECLSRGRLAAAASVVGFLKNLLNIVSDYVINTKVSDKPLGSFDHIQRQLGSITSDIYALESMVYLTAGIKDTYNNPDISIEESIVKVYSMEKIVEIVDKCTSLIGGSSYIKGSPLENFIRDSRSYLLHDIVPVNVTKIFIASLGLQHAGMLLQDDVKKARNPFSFPGHVLRSMWKEKDVIDDNVKTPGLLRLQLHPSLSVEADKLEDCIIRFEAATKNLLRRWGVEIIDRHMDLIRLADCAISIYAMTAVIGRASRSYCIGLTNADYDVITANVLCTDHKNKVKELVKDLVDGPMENNDDGYFKVGEKLIASKGYFFPHALERNY